MKIVNAVYGDSSGGRWTATLKTARLLSRQGHEVILLIDSVDADKVPADDAAAFQIVTLRNSGHYDLIASWKAARLLRDRGVEAVIAHSGRAVHLLKRAAAMTVPVIAFNHSHNIKRTLKADAFFCVTSYMKQIVDTATSGAKPSYIISNAISVPADAAIGRRGDDTFTIGAISRMVVGKGLETLVEALGLLQLQGVRFRASLAGDGELRAELERRVTELGLTDRVSFPGWIDEAGKADFFNSLDVVCYTSCRDVQPLTVLEAFGWGKALIGTDILGASSCYAHEETAVVVPPDDPRALADAVLRLRDDPALRTRLEAGARRQAIECHTDEVVAGMLDRCLRELVGTFAGKGA